jgi:two-component system sensor histidine kinase HydH
MVVAERKAKGGLGCPVSHPEHGDTPKKLFTPFFTTRATGTGLGLAVVQHVAILHEGEATGDNHPDGGAIFALWLPVTHGNPGARGDGQDPAGR